MGRMCPPRGGRGDWNPLGGDLLKMCKMLAELTSSEIGIMMNMHSKSLSVLMIDVCPPYIQIEWVKMICKS
jgi:hypothetical protein